MPTPPKRKRQTPNSVSPTWPSSSIPATGWTFPFALGAAIVVALIVLDAFPLNWAAQAFGLDSDGTLGGHRDPADRLRRRDAGLRAHPRTTPGGAAS